MNGRHFTQAAIAHLTRMSCLVILTAFGLTLAACSLPVPHENRQTTYRFNPIPKIKVADTAVVRLKPVVLRLNRITAANGFDSVAMVYSRDRQTLARYRDNRWIAPPAVLIGDAINLSLLHQPWVAGVLSGGQRMPAVLDIDCSLDRLEHDVLPTGGRVHLSLSCMLVADTSGKALDHWRFDRTRRIAVNDAQHYAVAAQYLLDQAQKELVTRVYRQVVRQARPAR